MIRYIFAVIFCLCFGAMGFANGYDAGYSAGYRDCSGFCCDALKRLKKETFKDKVGDE